MTSGHGILSRALGRGDELALQFDLELTRIHAIEHDRATAGRVEVSPSQHATTTGFEIATNTTSGGGRARRAYVSVFWKNSVSWSHAAARASAWNAGVFGQKKACAASG